MLALSESSTLSIPFQILSMNLMGPMATRTSQYRSKRDQKRQSQVSSASDRQNNYHLARLRQDSPQIDEHAQEAKLSHWQCKPCKACSSNLLVQRTVL